MLSPRRSYVFHPLTVLVVSALATGVFIILMLPLRRFAGRRRFFLLAYHAPIGFTFVTYLFDRAGRWKQWSRRQGLIEGPVLVLGLARALAPVPFISGHALFLSYLLVTTPVNLAWWVAALVLVDVIGVKLALRDATLLGGAGLGLLAGLLVRRGN